MSFPEDGELVLMPSDGEGMGSVDVALEAVLGKFALGDYPDGPATYVKNMIPEPKASKPDGTDQEEEK